MSEVIEIRPELFERNDYVGYFKQVYKRFGLKAIYKQFRYGIQRPFSRALISQYAPRGIGIEVGVGDRSISPASRTVLTDGFSEHDKNKSLAKLIFDSARLPFADHSFAFLVSEHMLEHVPNPLKVLTEWKRVLKPDGVLFLFMPHPQRTFDRLRPLTDLQNLKDDFACDRKIGEDPEHVREWFELVIEKGLAPHYAPMGRDEMIRQGCVHLHVWDTPKMRELLEYAGFDILHSADLVPDREDSFVVVAQVRGKPRS